MICPMDGRACTTEGGCVYPCQDQRQKDARHPLKVAMDEIAMRLRFGHLFDEIFRR